MFVGVLGSENPMSKSFHDDSWKEGYDLQSNSELISEMNWSEIAKGRENEDIVIHIRLRPREHLPEPEPEIVQAPPTQLVPPPPPPPPPPVFPPSFSQAQSHSQVPLGQENGVQSDGFILPTMPYGPPGNQLVHNQGLNPYYSYSLPASYFSPPMSLQPRFSYDQSLYRQSPYGNAYPYSAPYGYYPADMPSVKANHSLAIAAPFHTHRGPHHPFAVESKKALTSAGR